MICLFIAEGFANPGDYFSYMGARTLIQDTSLVTGEYMIRAEDALSENVRRQIPYPDIVVLAGAPWIWDQAESSEKITALRSLRKLFGQAKFAAVGIGSAFLVSEFNGIDNFSFVRNTGVEIFSEFDLVWTRDPLANAILSEKGVPASQIPDPAWFSVSGDQGEGAGSDEYLISSPLDSLFIAEYLEPAHFINWRQEESEARARGAREWSWIVGESTAEALTARGPSQTISRLAESKSVVTNRVHAAVLGRATGRPVRLFPVDSRALAAEAVGATLATPLRGPFSRLIFEKSNRSGIRRSLSSSISAIVGS